MRRLLTSLPIALLILMVMAVPMSVSASDLLFQQQYAVENEQTIYSEFTSYPMQAADNTTLPGGLTLAKGVPFISPSEVNKGDLVTVKVKATNTGTEQINYALSLLINGKSTGSPQQLALEPSGSKDVEFKIQAQTSGNNDVKVGNLQGFFTVKEGSFFDIFPPYLWIFFAVVAGIIILLAILMVMKPAKKKAGAPMEQDKMQARQKGKKIKPGGLESQMQGTGPMQRTPMQGMQERIPFGMQGQPGMPPEMTGMQQFPQQQGPQQQFQPQQQPGMQQQFPPQTPQPFQPLQPSNIQQQFPPQGMQPQFQPQQPGMQQFQQPATPGMQQAPQQGIQQPPMRGQQQYTPAPQMPHIGQQPDQQPIHGMPPGTPYGMQAPPTPGMQQPMQAPISPSMHAGMQPPVSAAYQSTGMPKFSVSNLTITPNNVKVGEPVNISIIVCNNGMQTGKYSVVLRIGGVVENISDLTLPPGASQTASFTVVKDAAGDYYADIDGLGGFFTVVPLTPPSFTVTNFSVGPERVRQGQPVTVTASVTNTGELTGSHTLILRVKGIAENQREITLGPGKTENVDFQVTKDTPGFYPISLENWTGKFVVEMDWTG